MVAAFDAGTITSDAGALLLGATDRAIRMMDRLASCFHDVRCPELIEHEVATLVGQRVFGQCWRKIRCFGHIRSKMSSTISPQCPRLAATRACPSYGAVANVDWVGDGTASGASFQPFAYGSFPARLIMEWMANQAGYYARAAQWLEKAELAHEVLGREDDWLCRPTANETLIPLPRRRHRGRSSIGASSPRSSWTPGSWSTPDCRHGPSLAPELVLAANGSASGQSPLRNDGDQGDASRCRFRPEQRREH